MAWYRGTEAKHMVTIVTIITCAVMGGCWSIVLIQRGIQWREGAGFRVSPKAETKAPQNSTKKFGKWSGHSILPRSLRNFGEAKTNI